MLFSARLITPRCRTIHIFVSSQTTPKPLLATRRFIRNILRSFEFLIRKKTRKERFDTYVSRQEVLLRFVRVIGEWSAAEKKKSEFIFYEFMFTLGANACM